MSLNNKSFTIFVAYPRDVKKEVNIITNVVNEINKEMSSRNFHLNLWTWEENSVPDFGDDEQEVINSQVKPYDIFIGIMWTRFGTPTKKAESGTVREYNIALAKWHSGPRSVRIMMYFNKQRLPFDCDLDQVSKVREFKKKIKYDGAHYCEYNGARDFEKKIGVHLHIVLDELGKNIEENREKENALTSHNISINYGVDKKSLFEMRQQHFYEEKIFLAKNFTPLLLKRCEFLINLGHKVYLVIDSGTTLFPFFDVLGRELKKLYYEKKKWIDDLTIITNNFAGIEAIGKAAHIDPNNRFSTLAIKNCKLLPGSPLPIYAAVVGPETNEALWRIRRDANRHTNALFLGLTTGNWIRIRNTRPICPIPLTRGAGQLSFKQSLTDVCDEIYVVSPLGKIIAKASLSNINEAFKLDELNTDPGKQPYYEIAVNKKANNVKLVTTRRSNNQILCNLSNELNRMNPEGINQNQALTTEVSLKKVPNIIFPFNLSELSLEEQIMKEFPHDITQQHEVMKKLFLVDKFF